MKKIPYRSNNLPQGFFSTLPNIHLHIDSPPQYQEVVLEIVKALDKSGHLSKLNYVDDFIAGPQRSKYPKEYGSHTPEIAGQEALDFFSTHALKDRDDAIEVLNFISKKLAGTQGIVVEVEQQIGLVRGEESKWLSEREQIRTIESSEVSMLPSPSLLYEIHHAFNLSDTHPISLQDWLEFCVKYEVEIGGLFLFHEGDILKYRSNSFSNGSLQDIRQQINEEQKVLKLFLKEKNIDSKVRTVCEKILQVGHT